LSNTANPVRTTNIDLAGLLNVLLFICPENRIVYVWISFDLSVSSYEMSAAGYESVLAGRMHFIGPDQRHGFEKRLVGDVTRNYPGRSNPIYGDLKGTPEAAIESRDNFLEHLNILRDWVKATNYQGVEEWQGDIAKNYLESLLSG
jgi:hypothetical protein